MNNNIQNIFFHIYKTNHWGSEQSVSGKGSTLFEANNSIKNLNNIIDSYKISSIFDASCGDFNWMRMVDLSKVKYVGSDIVKDLVESNNKKYSTDNISFILLDMTEDSIPKSDLVLVRDTLFHFSNNLIKKAINNIKRSGSKYLLTTSYIGDTSIYENLIDHKNNLNSDIKTGEWRYLDLCKEPFNLPQYIESFVEVEMPNQKGKSLCLWDLSELEYFNI